MPAWPWVSDIAHRRLGFPAACALRAVGVKPAAALRFAPPLRSAKGG